MFLSFLLVLGILVGAIALIDLAASRWGVDSRIVSNDPRKPEPGLFVR